MSDTPETEAVADFYMGKSFSTDPNDRTVPVQFAARLERERNEARDAIKELTAVIRALRATMREEARK